MVQHDGPCDAAHLAAASDVWWLHHMRTIWVTSVSPCPPTDGNRQRHLNLLMRIAAEHEVTLVCPVEDGEAHELDALHATGAKVVAVPNPGVPVSRVGRSVRRGLTLARRRP